MLPIPHVPNQAHLDKLYRAWGEGLARCHYIESCLYLAALGAMAGAHDECSAAFFTRPGIGSRLKFADERIRATLSLEICARDWEPIRKEVYSILEFRNALAHYEVYHLDDAEWVKITPPTAFKVILAGSHMNAATRKQAQAPGLTVETIERNSREVHEMAYALMYFVVDHFPGETFEGRGLLPLAERRLAEFRLGPRLPQFARRDG